MKSLKKYIYIYIILAFLAILACFASIKVINALRWEHSLLGEKLADLENTVFALSADIESVPLRAKHYDFEYPWLDSSSPVLLAHAMGGIDGQIYTNSKEALEYSYNNGFRVFEADFQLLDGQIVMLHDIERGSAMCSFDSNEYDDDMFLASKLYGEYTPMDWRMVLEFMQEHPDVYIVTDTKYDKQPHMSNVLSELVIEALEFDVSLLDRVVVQIYNQQMLDTVMDIYPFKSIIYTLYMSPDSLEEVKAFCVQSGIKAVTMYKAGYPDTFVSELNALGISSLAHTINDEQEANELIEAGYSGIYTDFLLPASK